MSSLKILCLLRFAVVPEMIGWELEAIGCKIRVLDGNPLRREDLAAACDDFRPDLLFTYAWWEPRVTPEDVDWLRRRYRLPHVYWAVDDPTHFHRISQPMAATADLVFTTTAELLPAYKAMGKKAALLQFACHPRLHRRLPQPRAERHDVVLVARNYSLYDPSGTTFRTHCLRIMVKSLVEAGFDLKVYGEGWDDSRRSFHIPGRYAGVEVPYEDLADCYSAAKIVLGLQTEPHSRTQTSCRVFEALGCRAFFLAPYTPAVAGLFTAGEHLCFSRSAAETAAVAHYYLRHDREREDIAAAGQAEVYRRHTYAHRAREFLAAVKAHL